MVRLLSLSSDMQFMWNNDIFTIRKNGKHGGGKIEIQNINTGQTQKIGALEEVELYEADLLKDIEYEEDEEDEDDTGEGL